MTERTRITRVLAPTDFTPTSTDAVNRAADLAAAVRARLTLVHVIAGPNEMIGIVPGATVDEEIRTERVRVAGQLGALADSIAARVPVAVVCFVDSGQSFTHAIVSRARAGKFDLIVMATHGRTAVGRLLLGSVAAGVLRDSPCPVLMVPARMVT